MWGVKVFDFFLQLVATGLGVYGGYVGGSKLLKKELEEERQQRIQEREADEEQKREYELQKRNRVIDSLLLEITLHKELLQKPDIKKSTGWMYAKVLPTFHFDGITASGLYIHLPSESQKIVSRHYQGCYKINYYIKTRSIPQEMRLREIQQNKTGITREIDGVLEKLKSLHASA